MKMRTTLLILAGLFVMSGGMLFAMSTLFSRDAQMRDASLDFAAERQAEFAQTRISQPSDAEPQTEEEAIAAMDEAPSLDEWYSSAVGTADEPLDPSPEEDDFFISDAEPTIDLDEEDDPEIF